LIEGVSNFSAYKGGRLSYVREYDPSPMIQVDLTTKMDIERAIKILFRRGELNKQEVQMLRYVMSDGRLSRRDISAMIQKEEGYYVDQRTISRRLDSAYQKISKFLGFEYSDGRIFKMIAKKLDYPPPYLLSDDEIDKFQTIMERV
jgi:isopropylmalate/homocitrate/citramalate synthase